MSFLSGAFLIALPLAAVPVLIHLYRGRQKDVILWGAMQFLATAVTKGRRMERIEELILMALRLGAVAALVFALARPMVNSNWLGISTDREVILVLDNSLSMSREIGGESAGDRMQQQAAEMIDSLAASDAVQVLLAVGSEWATAEGIAASAAGKRRLHEIAAGAEPTEGRADLLAALQAAVNLHAPDDLTGRRIIVFTDGQAGSWQVDATGAWRQLAAAREAADYPIAVEVVDCGHPAGDIENLAVVSLTAAQSMVRPGEQVELSAEIKNVGATASGRMDVEWLMEGKVVAESRLAGLDPNASARVATKLRMEEAGVFAVSCRLQEGDQVPLDQENSLIVEVADRIPILFVEGAEERAERVTASQLVSAALGYADDKPQAWHSIYQPELVPAASLATHPLHAYRAIVINNPADLDRAALERLSSFVRAGGGLWVALGDQVDREAFNRDWFSDGAGLSPLPLDALERIDDADDAAATVHPPTRDHSATLQLANTTQLDIDEARIKQRWRFAGEGAVSALLESGTGSPLVVENYVGQGRVLVQALPLGLEWSNLPLLKSYVVMVQDWLGYITAPTMARYNLSPGTTIIAGPPADATDAAAELTTPRGRQVELVASDVDLEPVWRYSQTRLPGVYRIRFTSGRETVGDTPFHVARDAAESDLTPLSAVDRDGLLAEAGVRFADSALAAAPAAATTASAPRREPFWGILLAALVVLLVGELLLSSWLARQRHGFSISTA